MTEDYNTLAGRLHGLPAAGVMQTARCPHTAMLASARHLLTASRSACSCTVSSALPTCAWQLRHFLLPPGGRTSPCK
jgi:hypothetical protein